MALKPTIYKFDISLSDLDREYYDAVNLTVALHPSESLERMMARVLAFCFNAAERLEFTRGLSEASEPDIWQHSLDGRIELWIEIGEPAVERVKKASSLTEQLKIYSFNSKSNTWWEQSRGALNRLPVMVFQFPWEQIKAVAKLVERTMQMSVTISESTAFVTAALGDGEVTCSRLSAG
jgi:uncharacterized protein YaeQ